ncbi:MAG TPA: primosomal protein N' [Candidatus Micrarchaeia archaeon]|nr:primosomal protein N' [Candidatus Micrarchaeia archaeon]
MVDPSAGPAVATVLPEASAGPHQGGFDYAVPEELRSRIRLGHRVVVPLGRRRLLGYVIALAADSARPDLRPVEALYDEEPLLPDHLVACAPEIADACASPLLAVIRAMLPPALRSPRPLRRVAPRGPRRRSLGTPAPAGVRSDSGVGGGRPAPELEPAQADAVRRIVAALDGGRGRDFLLHGVTGSGKTEVYLAAIAAALGRGRAAVVLVPEISLTPQTVRRFEARFPGRVALLHSALTDAERAAEWRRIRQGDAPVVVGSRSAVFAPLTNLGLLVVDEEDSSAYQQDRVPRYHAVDVARRIGRHLRIPVVLGSATPRIETHHAAATGAVTRLRLEGRIGGRPLPPIEVVDLRLELARGNRSPFAPPLVAAVDQALQRGGQGILFLNRRGTATVVLCRSCGEPLRCPHCSVALVHHADKMGCVCHYCGHTAPLPRTCPGCGSVKIKQLGMGTERLEAEVRQRWPAARLLRMDRDTVTERDAHVRLYEAFRAREADLMIGTQMVAKGWDLPGVQVVGIVNADTQLHLPDFRAAATTFALLTQVAGRAGRGDEPARVILQTYSPDHPAVRHAVTHDTLGFAAVELAARRALGFPPFRRFCVVTRSDAVDADAAAAAAGLAERLHQVAAAERLEVLGPSPAFVHRLRGRYRWQLTLRGATLDPFRPLLPEGPGWSIDVDPEL